MRQNLLGCLVGFFFITIVLQKVAGRSLGFLRALAQEEAEEEQQLAFDDVEQTNMISHIDKFTPKSKKPGDWVKVELPGSGDAHVIEEGQYYELTCKGGGRPSPKMYWIRGGDIHRQLDELKKDSLIYSPSRVINHGPAKMESKYVIDCASKQDEGPIHCVVIAGDEVKWDSTTILVSNSANSSRGGFCGSTRPPVITHHATTVVALQGSSVILPCVATGKPRPYMTWETSDGSPIANHLFNPRYKVLGTGALLIDALEWDDMNEYTCVARTHLGEDRVSTFIYPAQRDDRR